jgi:hypothetical protein
MKMQDVPFSTTDWNEVESVEYKGESGTSFWKTLKLETSGFAWLNIRLTLSPITGVNAVMFCWFWKANLSLNSKMEQNLP